MTPEAKKLYKKYSSENKTAESPIVLATRAVIKSYGEFIELKDAIVIARNFLNDQ
jgi:hypothetical protein